MNFNRSIKIIQEGWKEGLLYISPGIGAFLVILFFLGFFMSFESSIYFMLIFFTAPICLMIAIFYDKCEKIYKYNLRVGVKK